MESNLLVTPGARYRAVQATAFGQTQPEWTVEHVYLAAGIEHARLVSVGERKTLSSSTLRDRSRFERLQG
jgi:hypothetical protein